MRLTSPNKNNKELTAETTREAAISCLKKHLDLDGVAGAFGPKPTVTVGLWE